MSKSNDNFEQFETVYGVSFSLYNLKNTKNYYYYLRHEGNVYRGSTKTSDIKQAKIFTARIIDALLQGNPTPKPQKKQTRNNASFSQMFDWFLEDKTDLTQRGRKNYEVMKRFLIEYFGDWKEDDFKSYVDDRLYSEYQFWRKHYYSKEELKKNPDRKYIINGRDYTGQSVGNVTLNKECALLHNVLSHNKRYRKVLDNYKIPSFSRIHDVKKVEVAKTHIPTPEQYDAMKDWYRSGKKFHGKNHDRIYELYLRFMSNFGCRVGESLKLTVSDISKDGDILYIRNRKSNKGNRIDTPFPLVGKAKHIIERILEHTEEARQKIEEEEKRTGITRYVTLDYDKNILDEEKIPVKDILFLNPSTLRELGYIKKSFNRCVRDIGAYYIDKRSHKRVYFTLGCFRHLFLVKFVKQNVPLPILADLVGHTNIETIQKNYVELKSEDLKRGLEDAYITIDRRREERSKSW